MNPPRRPSPSDRPASADARDTAAGSRTAPGGGHPPREPLPGEMIGPYRIVRELGRGGMAVVFEAEDTELARRVALKVLVGPAADAVGKLRFVREAQAQAKVSHEHVVTIFRVGEDRGVSYLAMPVLNGQSLAQALVATPKPPLPSVIRIATEIAEGLAAAHAAGLIHRDIKPANIWLEAPKWRVKILDFGLARPPHADGGGDITIQGQVVGTPAYMSPEQTAGRPVDHRTDLWSLGVVLYQMTTGEKPFVGDNTLSLMTSIVAGDPPPPVALAPDVPPALSALILRLLAKDPAFRPATAEAVAAELAALGGAPASPPSGWHPPLPAAADPWSGLDSSAVITRPEPVRRPKRRDEDEDEDDYDDRPRRKRRDDRDDRAPPRSLRGVWIGLLAAAAILLLAGLVWLAIDSVSPKTKPTEPTFADKGKDGAKPVPVPVPVPVPKVETDRAAAEALGSNARLKIQIDGRSTVEVAAGNALPPGRITILTIDFENSDALGPIFVTGTLLPALTNLKSLTDVKMRTYQMTLTPEHLRQMAAMPLANTLVRLDARVELTPASAADLRKFTALKDLTVAVPKPDDALFARLGELRQVERLALHSVSPAAGLTDAGWAAVAAMPLEWLTVIKSPAAPEALRALTVRRAAAPPALIEFVSCPDLTDDDLRDLGTRPTDVKFVAFRSVPITDEGLKHLAGVKSLIAVSVQLTRATERGARALYAARPDLKILYDDRLIKN